jgi:hypothetical protein
MVFPACGEKQGEEEEEAAHDDDDDDDDAPLVSNPLLSHSVPLCLASLLLLSLQPHFLPLHPPPSPAAAVVAGGACSPSLWFPHVLASQIHSSSSSSSPKLNNKNKIVQTHNTKTLHNPALRDDEIRNPKKLETFMCSLHRPSHHHHHHLLLPLNSTTTKLYKPTTQKRYAIPRRGMMRSGTLKSSKSGRYKKSFFTIWNFAREQLE